MDIVTAENIMVQLQKDYDIISKYFSHTRMNQWYEVSFLVDQYVEPGDRVLDLGCGNGRVADLLNGIKAQYVGVDASPQLIEIARTLHPENEFYVGSILQTDFADNSFDHLMMIASFHHIPSQQYRLQTLAEAKRLVKPGGYIIVTNWNLHQWRFLPLRILFAHKKILSLHKMDFNDVFVPWKDNKKKVLARRYYHAFTKKEIATLARKSNLKLVDQYYETHGMHVPRYKAHNLVSILQV